LRGTYQQAVRAPNIIEFFTPQGTSLFTMNADPCGPTMSATLMQCLLTGLKPSQYGQNVLDDPGFQYHNLVGGNPDLKPETAKTYTIGAVLQPIAGLRATIDYWNIRITKVIGTIPPTLALTQCLSAGQFCDLIHRDPTFGSLWLNGGFITSTNINLGSYKTDGIDVTVNWTHPLERYGSVAINFIGTWLDQFIVEPVPGLGSYDCAGLYGNTCGLRPKWRSRLQGIWSTPWNWDLGATWRYFSSVAIDQSSSNPLLAGAFAPKESHLGTRTYLDLVAQWKISENLIVRGGVNNVFDRDPPITTIGSFTGNTFPQTYDALGRYLFLNVTAKF
jgi:iron complex outermembrane receptor protein